MSEIYFNKGRRQKILTVVIPAYNIENYIDFCLSSFLADSIPEDDIEVLVINDGSSDNTESIARRYEELYPDIFRVITKSNGGHGSAINTGIANAVGKYLKVVDGDDWVEYEQFVKYLELLRETDADLIATDFCCVSAETLDIVEQRSSIIRGENSEGMYRFDEICDRLLVRMHSVTWRRSILTDHRIHIDENRYYVDMEYILYPIPYVESVYVSHLPVYMYRLGMGGQSVSLKSMRRNVQQHLDVINANLRHLTWCVTKSVSPQKIEYIQRGIAEMITMQCKVYLSYPLFSGKKKALKDMDTLLLQNYPGVYNAVSNKYVLLLRRSDYMLFPVAAIAVSVLEWLHR